MMNKNILLLLLLIISCKNIDNGKVKLDNVIKKFKLNKYNIEIKKLEKNSISIYTQKKEDDLINIGDSKIGGLPDLPKNIKIPKWKNKSLSFIAQFNLNEISKYDLDNLLPKSGFLYFFYNQEQETWGFDPKDKNSFKVLYYDVPIKNLVRIKKPDDLGVIYQSCILSYKNIKNIPPYESEYINSIKLNDLESDDYFNLETKINGEGIIHKLFGYPNQIQGDMQYECPLVTKGLYLGDTSGYNDPRVQEYEKDYDKWLLLLQIDSDENAGMMWGDVGRIYFWIKKEDLLNKTFENVWVILQCS